MYKMIQKIMLTAFCLSAFSGYAEVEAKPVKFQATQIEGIGGDKLTIPDTDKKVTVLVFLSCDCPIANAFAPELGRIYDAYKDKDVAFYRVYPDTSQSAEKINEHTDDYKYMFSAIRDEQQTLVKLSGARITPEAVVIKADGSIVYRGRINDLFADIGKRRREATTADLRDAIDAALENKPVATPETKAFGCHIPLEFEESAEDAPAS